MIIIVLLIVKPKASDLLNIEEGFIETDTIFVVTPQGCEVNHDSVFPR